MIAVIFTAVMLAIGVSLASIGYKQVTLSSTVAASQKAFYAADTALECVLSAVHGKQQGKKLSVTKSWKCNGNEYKLKDIGTNNSSWDIYSVVSYTGSSQNMKVGSGVCAQAWVYWPESSTSVLAYTYTVGYNNPTCSINRHATTQGVQTTF